MAKANRPTSGRLHDETAEQPGEWAKQLREESEAARKAAKPAAERAKRFVADARMLRKS